MANSFRKYQALYFEPEYQRPMTETEIFRKLGKRIRTIRQEKGITQNELAKICGFEKASMSRIESGLANPTTRTLYKISKALDVALGDFFK